MSTTALERLWSLTGNNQLFRCELHDRGHWGTEAQIHWNGRMLIGWRFETRALALEWALEERADLEHRHTRIH